MEFALFLTGSVWVLAARSAASLAAAGIAFRFHLDIYEPLLSAAFLAFLLMVGFAAINWIAIRSATLRGVNALPSRATAGSEWTMGAALGWALVVIAVLPMALVGDLHPSFWFQPRAFLLVLIALLTLVFVTLAQTLMYRGYLFARLIRAMGPTMATLVMSLIFAIASSFSTLSTPRSVFITFLFGILLSMAYLRTHALWLAWGLSFGWAASMGILFGLPVGGSNAYASVVDTSVSGWEWITGGLYGPQGALFTVIVVLVGMGILYRMTRDLAWQYTHPVIVAAGYAMDVAPPAEHVKMEQAAAAPQLVQILATTPSASSTMPAIDEHLRANSESDAGH